MRRARPNVVSTRGAWDPAQRTLVLVDPHRIEEQRTACEEGRLVCPVAGCPTPRLTPTRGYLHHTTSTPVPYLFRHVVGGHSPETAAHVAGKTVLATHLGRLGCTVEIERQLAGTRRRPELTVRAPDGSALAIEVQVSPISPQDWTRRTSDLASTGSTVQWFWGADCIPMPGSAVRRSLATAGLDIWSIDGLAEEPTVTWALVGTYALGADMRRVRLAECDLGAGPDGRVTLSHPDLRVARGAWDRRPAKDTADERRTGARFRRRPEAADLGRGHQHRAPDGHEDLGRT